MGQITSLFVRKVVSIVDGGVDKGSVLRSVGIEPDDPVDPSKMVADTEYDAFLERVAAADGDGTSRPHGRHSTRAGTPPGGFHRLRPRSRRLGFVEGRVIKK